MSRVTIIAAVAHGGAIGRRGDLLFHISADLRRFKALTMGHPIIMGRKTFESFPKGALPGRRNIVITRQHDYTRPGIETASSLDEALALASPADCFVIGGGEIYRQAMPHADELQLTLIDADVPDADTFFPVVDPTVWAEAEAAPGGSEPVPFRFATYLRK